MRILEVDLHKVFLEKMENVQMTSILCIISFWVFQFLRCWIEWKWNSFLIEMCVYGLDNIQ